MAVLKLKATGLFQRKTTGVKMGESFAKQITRAFATHGKKHANEPTQVEVDLEGKELTDEGLVMVLEALQTALSEDSACCLEEFNLQQNDLTTAALRLLIPIIEASAFDLRILDLSGNKIRVVTKEEARDWEDFLHSFRDCRVLYRLDFSRNNLSQSLALEIFTRVYVSHPPIDPNELEDPLQDPVYRSLDEPVLAKLTEKTNSLVIKPRPVHTTDYDPMVCASSLSNGLILKRRAGLRSVPYIFLRNVNMTDAGALHFSYVLEHHYWPQYLMTSLKEGSGLVKRKEDCNGAQDFGLVYGQNPKVSAAGQKLLDLAEMARVDLAGISQITESTANSYADPVEGFFTRERKVFSVSTSSGRARRFSAVSMPDNIGNYSRAELDSLRKKLQRTTIESLGVSQVQLWATAFRMLNVARAILPMPTIPIAMLEPEPEPVDEHDFPAFPEPLDTLSNSPSKPAAPVMTLRILAPSTQTNSVQTLTAPACPSTLPNASNGCPKVSPYTGHTSLAATIFSQGRITSATVSSTAVRTTPTTISSGQHSPNNLTRDCAQSIVSTLSSRLVGMVKHQFIYRDHTYPATLHSHLWDDIISEEAGARGILTRTQQQAIIRYARDRCTLASEQQSQGKGESHQIWKTLEAMGCLVYEIPM